jgi:serine/threonine protein kinase
MRYQPGMIIRDTYELEALIGAGASGEVWRANDNGTIVAIKFMNESLLHGEKAQKHRQRLEREIYALGLLQHPNIPRLHDFDLDFERPFVVMDFISSPTFEHMLNTGDMMRIPVTERLHVLEQIASALTSAHEAGIIHRDIKPGNMNGIDPPYLLDFSVALEEESLEHTNFNVGTTIYMTPGGEPPDRLADNYSFCVVAYEVLYGEHPLFPRDDETRNAGTYSRIVAFNRLASGDWRIPSKLPQDQIPYDMQDADARALTAIFQRAFGDREKRYLYLEEFIADLKQAILTPGTLARAASMPHTEAPQPPQSPQVIPQGQSFTVLEVEGSPSDHTASAPTPEQPTVPSPLQPQNTPAEESIVDRLKKGFGRFFGNG